MMGQPKPLASLSSGLLARKGQARPAMRPSGFAGFGSIAGAIDDLGWNDMGTSEPVDDSQVLPIAPVIVPPTRAEKPPVLQARDHLRDEFEAPADLAEDQGFDAVEAEAEPAPVLDQIFQAKRPKLEVAETPAAAVATANASAKGKIAFTLRLDSERHLRLRLASALVHQSAQQLVTAALDSFLQSIPDVEELAARAEAGGAHHSVGG